MRARSWIARFVGLALLAPWSATAGPRATSPGGNARTGEGARVLLIDIDDVGFDLLRDAPTPALDWIEANGRFYTSFTTGPQCTMTRSMLMTGAYGSHPDVLVGNTIRGDSTYAMPLAPLVPLPALVVGAGRTTAKVGKWHLAPRAQREHVRQAGWQSYAGVQLNLGNGGTFTYSRFPKVINGVEAVEEGTYLTTDETNDGIRCVLAGIDLVSVSYHAPHTPFHVPPPDLHSILDTTSDRDKARAMLQALDRELGRLVRVALEHDYTVLVFSDNGTALSIGGQKGTLFDGSIVTPMWAIGPGVVPGVDGSRVGVVDLYATVAELLGVAAGGAARGPHSRSFVRSLAGLPEERRWTYAERFQENGVDPDGGTNPWRKTARGARYKLVSERWGQGERLYDLWANPSETYDLLTGPPLQPAAAAALAEFRRVLSRL